VVKKKIPSLSIVQSTKRNHARTGTASMILTVNHSHGH